MKPSTPDHRPRVLAFGEILWDVVGDREHIGGAPFNFAAHAVRCGLSADLMSRVGQDPRGDRARREVDRLGVGAEFLQIDPLAPTGWVDVQLHDGQPSYTICEGVAWDAIAPPDREQAAQLRERSYAALVFGTLAQRSKESRAALHAVRSSLQGVPALYDINLRAPHTPVDRVVETLPGVTWLKLNADEAAALWQRLGSGAFEAERLFARLHRDFGVGTLILTKGAAGASLCTAKGRWDVPAAAVRLVSAVGAGDAFAAAFLAASLTGLSPQESLRRAVRVAGWVASQPEAIPEYPSDLLAEQ